MSNENIKTQVEAVAKALREAKVPTENRFVRMPEKVYNQLRKDLKREGGLEK